jgi:Cys-rich repeat protein
VQCTSTNTTACPVSSCSGSTLTSYACNTSSNTCQQTTQISCNPFVCGTGACLTSCTSDAQCQSGNYCLSGTCVHQLASGGPCTANDQCSSGVCTSSGFCQ